MKKGEFINGYKILENFTTLKGGLSKWTFAEKKGKLYFLKEFLSPTYPIEGSPGSSKTKEKKKAQCEAFEQHHKTLMDALSGKSAIGGNLVVAEDFFRFNTRYYKLTEKIDVASLSITDISRLTIEKRLLILKTISHSLRILHTVNIVHGDLKPDNILIKETKTGSYTTKLIDFDNSFFAGKPPNQIEELVGDVVYYSPELGLFVEGKEGSSASNLQTKSDIFSLGLIFHQYLTGQLPDFNGEKFKYPYAVVNDGAILACNKALIPIKLCQLINNMLNKDWRKRPDIDVIFTTLKAKDILSAESLTDKIRVDGGNSLTGSLVSKIGGERAENSTSSLRGTLLRKNKG